MIEARHTFLESLLGKVKPEETESYEMACTLVINITSCLCIFSLLEAVFYYLFSTKVNINLDHLTIYVTEHTQGSSLEEDYPG